VVVAVVAVAVVQPAIDEVIVVVAVRHQLVAAPLMVAGARGRSARRRVGLAHLDPVLVVVAVVPVVQVAVVQVVHVPVVLNAGVAAVAAVLVAVASV
jgi:hypothetical protein